MWTVSFTFKYLPNIIQRFYTHVAVWDTLCADRVGLSRQQPPLPPSSHVPRMRRV